MAKRWLIGGYLVDKGEIQAIVTAYQLGEITEPEMLNRMALLNTQDAFEIRWELLGIVGAALIGFTQAGPLGAIALGMIAGDFLEKKLKRGRKIEQDLERGDYAAYLPERYSRLALSPAPSQPAQPVAPTTPAPSQPAQPTAQAGDIALQIANYKPVRSLFFCGASQTGKSVIASRAASHIKQTLGDRCVWWVFSAKKDPKEFGYWQHADRLEFFDFLHGDSDTKGMAFYEWLNALRTFKQLDKPVCILTVDELSLIGGVAVNSPSESTAAKFWTEFTEFMLALSSAGASSNKAVWVISPTGQVGGLGLNRTNIGAFTPVYVSQTTNASPGWNQTVYLGAKNNGLAPSSKPNESVTIAAQQCGSNLVVGLADTWHACQKYQPPTPSAEVSRRFHSETSAPKPQAKPAETGETVSETETYAKPLETRQSNPFQEFPKLSGISETSVSGNISGIDPETVKLVKLCETQGMTQKETIQCIWGLSPGGSQKYQDAVSIYKTVVNAS